MAGSGRSKGCGQQVGHLIVARLTSLLTASPMETQEKGKLEGDREPYNTYIIMYTQYFIQSTLCYGREEYISLVEKRPHLGNQNVHSPNAGESTSGLSVLDDVLIEGSVAL